MKIIKLAGLVMGVGLGLLVGINNVQAITITKINPDFKIITPIPTSIIVKKIIDPNLKKIVTSITPTVTAEETASPTATVTESEITPTSGETEEAVLPTEAPTVTATVAASTGGEVAGEQVKSQDNLTIWFLVITVAMLAVIIVVQAWPKKEDEKGTEE